MDELCKVVFMVTGIIAMGISFLCLDYAYGESDFTLEAKFNKSDSSLNITKFEIQGEGYKEMCPSGQCKIDYIDKYTSFGGPSADRMSFGFSNLFDLKDNGTYADVGPKKKEFMEKFKIFFVCTVGDIIEDNGQEIYTCPDGSANIWRKFDNRGWNYDTIAMFDAKKNALKVYGNFTRE